MSRISEVYQDVCFAICLLAVTALCISLPFMMYSYSKQVKECSAKGGVMSRDMGCVDLKRISIP